MCGFLIGKFSDKEEATFKDSLAKIQYRGPDDTEIVLAKNHVYIGFHRLAIMDLTGKGNQPFYHQDKYAVCNGEIYNFQFIKSDFEDTFPFKSDSDCEVLLPLYLYHGIEKTCQVLDGEFAFVLYDEKEDRFIAARDHMGIRPMFYGKAKTTGEYAFASEVKALIDLCDDIKPFPPGHYFDGKDFCAFADTTSPKTYIRDLDKALKGIRELLTSGVKKRLHSDAPLGFLLSGGLDSSLVCAIAHKLTGKKITTFAVGIEEGPIDTKYARIVADYIGSDHHEVLFKKADIFRTLEDLIYHLETYDITTIRASMGMNLVCEYIKEKTDIKVVLTGEVSDELFGYKYTDFAPSAEEFQKEAKKRIDELYMYDVLRADRCIASNSLEARVPFSDKEFVEFVMSIDPSLKMNTTGIGKYLLRKAFEDDDYLPEEILMREKAAFSDAQGHAVVDYLKAHAESLYTDEEFEMAKKHYEHATPQTKEALMYREMFEKKFSGMSYLVKDFWLPNKEWKNCDVIDPSARVLPNYGKSGE
ncbi:putative asparagine synthase (glutamine-hydrolyzing) [Bacteriovorax sp. BSW11_IV]|uniref:asparagine synthase B n=1 Tax=Bacteriovorax sp. BSW11_IV TaxID=1353529 RepID=UPI00038A4664|nr:asparagine synthase B [Bacteriovorax sp. BSW11_IV]EQC49543.1 putative asparagine synthase (glutamine-hydrolyzing) [Bacteriovorax sp. BSW11_IV]